MCVLLPDVQGVTDEVLLHELWSAVVFYWQREGGRPLFYSRAQDRGAAEDGLQKVSGDAKTKYETEINLVCWFDN